MTKGMGKHCEHTAEIEPLGILGTALGLRFVCVHRVEGWGVWGTHLMRIRELSEGVMGK